MKLLLIVAANNFKIYKHYKNKQILTYALFQKKNHQIILLLGL